MRDDARLSRARAGKNEEWACRGGDRPTLHLVEWAEDPLLKGGSGYPFGDTAARWSGLQRGICSRIGGEVHPLILPLSASLPRISGCAEWQAGYRAGWNPAFITFAHAAAKS